MNNFQTTRLSMFIATRDYLNDNAAIVSGIYSFPGLLSSFTNTILKIQEMGSQQEFYRGSVTNGKNQLRSNLIEVADDVAKRMIAFAKISDNSRLLGEMDYKIGDLMSRGTALVEKCTSIHKRATDNLSNLSNFDINEQSLQLFADAINAFNNSISGPQIGRANKKIATNEVSILFDTANGLLDKMDALVKISKDHNFKMGYRVVRKHIMTGTNSIALRAFAVDSETSEPIKGALFKIMSNGGSGARSLDDAIELVKRTTPKGGFMVKDLPEGNYQILISKPGYRHQEVSAVVCDGEVTRLKIKMQKN